MIQFLKLRLPMVTSKHLHFTVCALTYGVWDVFIEEKLYPWKLSESTLFSLEYVRNTKHEKTLERELSSFEKANIC